jgi:hypothetical protein
MVCPSGCQRKTPFFGRGQPCPRHEEIRECLVHAEECGRLSKTAFTPCGIKD